MTSREWDAFYNEIVTPLDLAVGLLFPAFDGGMEVWRLVSWKTRVEEAQIDPWVELQFYLPRGSYVWTKVRQRCLSREDVVLYTDKGVSSWEMWLETGFAEEDR